MRLSPLGSHLVLNPATNRLEPFDLDALRDALQAAFEEHSAGREWVADGVLDALRERLALAREADDSLTAEDILRAVVAFLDNSGFADVAQSLIRRTAPPPRPPTAPLLANIVAEASAPTQISLTSPVRYIQADGWLLPLSPDALEMAVRRLVVPQPVSDIIPVPVVLCRLDRALETVGTPPSEEAFLQLLPRISSAAIECLALMRDRMSRDWAGIEQGVPVVRFSALKSVVPVLARSRQPKARKETRLRLQDAIHASLSGAPLLLKVLL